MLYIVLHLCAATAPCLPAFSPPVSVASRLVECHPSSLPVRTLRVFPRAYQLFFTSSCFDPLAPPHSTVYCFLSIRPVPIRTLPTPGVSLFGCIPPLVVSPRFTGFFVVPQERLPFPHPRPSLPRHRSEFYQYLSAPLARFSFCILLPPPPLLSSVCSYFSLLPHLSSLFDPLSLSSSSPTWSCSVTRSHCY